MKTISYFAYGSNMSTAQMSKRCPNAIKIGVATLTGYEFMINKKGYAGVIAKQDALVIGILWIISSEDKAALDICEGAYLENGAYYRKYLAVVTEQGSVDSLVYIARNTTEGQPNEGYLELIVDAARDHGIDGGYVQSLEAWQQ
jgi:gamma-glutamylcyclotransferase